MRLQVGDCIEVRYRSSRWNGLHGVVDKTSERWGAVYVLMDIPMSRADRYVVFSYATLYQLTLVVGFRKLEP